MPKFKLSSKRVKLDQHNSTAKMKSKGMFVTPKRGDENPNLNYKSNYSQDPTPVPEYRFKRNR